MLLNSEEGMAVIIDIQQFHKINLWFCYLEVWLLGWPFVGHPQFRWKLKTLKNWVSLVLGGRHVWSLLCYFWKLVSKAFKRAGSIWAVVCALPWWLCDRKTYFKQNCLVKNKRRNKMIVHSPWAVSTFKLSFSTGAENCFCVFNPKSILSKSPISL